MVSADVKDCAYGIAVARHVSADGCQLVMGQARTQPGQRFRFHLAGFAPVSGTVRWTVADRAGFAFDSPLCRSSLRILSGHGAAMQALQLYFD